MPHLEGDIHEHLSTTLHKWPQGQDAETYLLQNSPSFHGVQGFISTPRAISQCPTVRCAFANKPAIISVPSDIATPNDRTNVSPPLPVCFTSSTAKVRRVMGPTQIGRHFSQSSVRLLCRNRSQEPIWKVSGLPVIRHSRDPMAGPKLPSHSVGLKTRQKYHERSSSYAAKKQTVPLFDGFYERGGVLVGASAACGD